MAVYGKDFYGLAKYGADIHVEYSVEPFEAQPDGYHAVRMTWSSPSGNWTRMRLLKSRLGYAVNADDGEILFDSTTPINYWTDAHLAPGSWYYYTLYLKVGGVWHRVGVASSIVVRDCGFAGLLWDRIPYYFHWVPRYPTGEIKTYFTSAEVYDPDRLDQANQHLQQFLTVLAWGLDFMRTYSETTLWANDTRLTHLENLDRLARTLGTVYEYEIPVHVMRSKVANTALLARSRGTLAGLRDAAALGSAYDVGIEVGPNMFLSEDQANFAHPTYAEWDSATNYPTGHRVQYSGRIMEAKAGGAYGGAQKPPDAPTASNTWWQVVNAQVAETLRDTSTGAISTWKMFRSASPDPIQESIQMGVGVSSPVDTTVSNSNSLFVKNTNVSTQSYLVWGAANPTGVIDDLPTPLQVIKQGLPVPRLLAWDSAQEYQSGTVVVYGSRAFRALRFSVGREPELFTQDWVQVGADERPRLALSFYSHSDFDGSAGIGITPGVAFFDQHGQLIREIVDSSHSRGAFFDTFNGRTNTPITTHTPDQQFATETWAVNSGTWQVAQPSDGERVAWPVTGSGTLTVRLPTEKTFYKVAVTFKRPALAGKTQALVLRYVDSSNHLRITRTGVDKVEGGTVTNLVTFVTSVKDSDRVTVLMNETTNTQTVYVNGVVAPIVIINLIPNPSFEVDTAGWAAESNCTIARSTAQASSGVASMAVTITGAGSGGAITATGVSGMPVMTGATYTATGGFRAATTGRTCTVYINWYTSAGAFISNISASVVDTTTGFSNPEVTGVAPATAAYASVATWVAGATAGEVHYVDAIDLRRVGTTAVVTGQPQPAAGVGSDRYRHGLRVV